ncbi:helix-turn-helix domain-containing protein [Nocardioides sp. AE5]|uniref:IclR family transcriptional regulator n=1 Tax=Nocardioides sp. AE5 TaxID=2962573 RepID=UPI002880D733|nr:helix-turn-helix domain-containing protein [Nocardioides sp. AE5]MDT0203229.1 helix-turn-helix domain-containing protein [Nocardioides sp. AE5]
MSEAGSTLLPESRTGMAERVVSILETLLSTQSRLRLDEIMAATDLPRSTTSRLLTQLHDLGWVEHDNRGYAIGPRHRVLTGRGPDSSQSLWLRSSLSNTLNDLHAATGAVVHLSVLEGPYVLYLDKVGGPAARSVPSRVGATYRADLTVSGRALLACESPERVDLLMRHTGTDHVRCLDRLHGELVRIRSRRGIARDDFNRCHRSIRSLAVPVLGPDGPVGALSLATRGAFREDRVVPLLAFAARSASTALFPDLAAEDRSDRRRQRGRAPGFEPRPN